MAYWWVNQNQTAQHEIPGGYMWSPKRKRNGARNQFYENMKAVQAGDIVFSYAKQKISHVGVIADEAVAGSKPSEFGLAGDYWERWWAVQGSNL